MEIENEKKYNHIFAKIAGVIYILAVILLVVGFVKTFNNAANITPPGGFEGELSPTPGIDSGSTTIRVEFDNGFDFVIFFFFGGLGMFLGTVFLIIDVIKSRKTIATGIAGFSSKMFHGLMDSAVNMKMAMEDKIKKAKKARIERCEYCGTELKEDERKCPNCGANK